VPAWLILAARRPDASEMTRHTSMALRPASGDDDDAAALACAAPLQAKVRTAEPDEPSWHVATPTPKTSPAPAAGRHWSASSRCRRRRTAPRRRVHGRPQLAFSNRRGST
jgi:hypothetical protein